MDIFETLESEVRGYCRAFPAVFASARGAVLVDERGRNYLDFFSGAGVLSYGHNHPRLKQALIDYLSEDGIVHALDMATIAKRDFLERFRDVVLEPRKLDFKVQFPGPTGTNAIEAALKLARKVTGRQRVISFTNAFHGMTLGSLAITGNAAKRAGAGVPLDNTAVVPFDGYLGKDVDTLDYLERVLDDGSSGVDTPAAVVVETVQAEGGVHVAGFGWLRRLRRLTAERDILLIVDDIQVGCGRTGPFFSFEPADIVPDIVCLSKSLSGFGLPLALTLFRPELDVWSPGEHNGTFRGHNAAFVTASAALEFWQDDALSKDVMRKAEGVVERLRRLVDVSSVAAEVRGRGLIHGVAFSDSKLASEISAEAFRRGLVIETAGPDDEVLKLLPPLTIEQDELERGLDIIEASVNAVVEKTAALVTR